MTANGIKVAEGALPKTIPQQISIGEGLHIRFGRRLAGGLQGHRHAITHIAAQLLFDIAR